MLLNIVGLVLVSILNKKGCRVQAEARFKDVFPPLESVLIALPLLYLSATYVMQHATSNWETSHANSLCTYSAFWLDGRCI